MNFYCFRNKRKRDKNLIRIKPCGETEWAISMMVYNVAGTNLQLFINNTGKNCTAKYTQIGQLSPPFQALKKFWSGARPRSPRTHSFRFSRKKVLELSCGVLVTQLQKTNKKFQGVLG